MRKLFNFMPIILLSVGMVFFYQSCSDDNIDNFTNSDVQTRTDTAKGIAKRDFEERFKICNPYRLKLTEIISIACCRKPFLKKAIKSSVREFQSNYNLAEDEMFFNIQKDKPNQDLGGKTISAVLIETVPEMEVEKVLEFLCANDPGLAILLEGNLQSNSVSNNVLIDENFDDTNLQNEINSYACGQLKKMAVKDEATFPEMVFVIRESEAYSPSTQVNNGYVEAKSLGVFCNNNIVVIGNSINGPDTNPNTDPEVENRNNPCPTEWRTVQNGKENLYRYKTSDDFDPWRGKGEFLQFALFGKDLKYKYNQSTGVVDITGAVTDFVQKRQENVKDNFEWKIVNADLFRWYPENNGYRYKILWFEDDGGKSKPIIDKITLVAKVKLPDGTSAEGQAVFDINELPDWLSNGDDVIGENIVDYCDTENFDYTPNSIDVTVFNLSER
jgi:hypothetical protein